MPSGSPNYLNVAVADWPTWEGPLLRGLVFDPTKVYSGKTTSAFVHYNSFFATGTSFRTVVVETYMGPGEFAKALRKFDAQCPSHMGDYYAYILVHADRLDEMLEELRDRPESYLASKEKGLPA